MGEDKKKLLWMLMPSQVMKGILILPHQMLQIPLPCFREPFPVFPEKTTLSMLRFLNLDSPVKVKLMEDIMPMVKPNAKFSTFAQLMELVVSLSTASCAPTQPSSTRTTSSVTGGLTLIVLKLKVFSLSMMKLLLNVLLLMKLLLMKDTLPLLRMPLPNMVLPDLQGRDHLTAETVEDRRARSSLRHHLSRTCCISSQCNVTH